MNFVQDAIFADQMSRVLENKAFVWPIMVLSG